MMEMNCMRWIAKVCVYCFLLYLFHFSFFFAKWFIFVFMTLWIFIIVFAKNKISNNFESIQNYCKSSNTIILFSSEKARKYDFLYKWNNYVWSIYESCWKRWKIIWSKLFCKSRLRNTYKLTTYCIVPFEFLYSSHSVYCYF